jgi:hypothetical protein
MATYAEERLAAWRANSKEIRRRSGEMERNVAKFLLGRRVPYSGAGAAKGDCEVETEKVGRIFIECKYSASRTPTMGPRLRIDYRWFDKMARDAEIMHARFPALVFRYHDVRLSNYVIISTDVLEKYDPIDRLTGAAIIDTGDKSGIELFKVNIDKAFAEHLNHYEVAILQCNRGRYVITTLALFKEMIHVDTNSI